MKNDSMKKALEKSKNVLEKHKNGQAKKLHKKTFKIIAMNLVQEQLKTKIARKRKISDGRPKNGAQSIASRLPDCRISP